MKKYSVVGILVLAVMASAGCNRQKIDPVAYRADMEQWHTERLLRLKQKNSWLTLAGLYWLPEGTSTFGSDSSNTIVFPAGAPPFAGKLERRGDTVFLISTEVPMMVDSVITAGTNLRSDAAGKPSVVTLGSFAWHVIKRGNLMGIRLRDFESPMVHELDSIPFYEINLRWRITADYKPFDTPEKQKVQTVVGVEAENIIPGVLSFSVDGKKMKLYPVAGEGEWSIVFGDLTNGDVTYPGGRFLDISVPDGNNKVVIDFNKAYNPPCAFTPYATCQLPHRSNMLPVKIEAGEKSVHLVQVH